MPKEIEQKLMEQASSILEAITTAVGQAKDLAIEQLPDIAYQYITFYRAYYPSMLVLGIVLLVAAIIIGNKITRICGIILFKCLNFPH